MDHDVCAALLSVFSLLDVILNLAQAGTGTERNCRNIYLPAVCPGYGIHQEHASDLKLKFPAASQLPLKGIFQGIKLIGAILVGILMISLLIGQSPAILISGLGAMAAVLMLVFKDPILGLVAGIQLSANDMLKLGDWLEMPKYGADGAVIDIGLTTVKVRNWDNTITTIPTWSLVSDSFKNWSGMSASGGRRIKRSISIDVTSIRFLDEDEIIKPAPNDQYWNLSCLSERISA